MSGGVRLGIAGILAAVAMLVFAGSASACSCGGLSPKAVERADAAAVMKLVNVEDMEQLVADFTYEVRDVLSGSGVRKGDSVTIRSSRDGAACGLDDRVGRKKGLLLDRKRGNWFSNLCAQTSPRNLRRLAAGRRGGPSGCA